MWLKSLPTPLLIQFPYSINLLLSSSLSLLLRNSLMSTPVCKRVSPLGHVEDIPWADKYRTMKKSAGIDPPG